MDTTPLEMEAMIGRTGCHWRRPKTKQNRNTSNYPIIQGSNYPVFLCKQNDNFRAKWQISYSNIQQKFSPSSMQDLHQVPDALFPDVEGVLPGWTGHNVFTVARETAALPGSPEGCASRRYEHKMHRQPKLWVTLVSVKANDMAGGSNSSLIMFQWPIILSYHFFILSQA